MQLYCRLQFGQVSLVYFQGLSSAAYSQGMLCYAYSLVCDCSLSHFLKIIHIMSVYFCGHIFLRLSFLHSLFSALKILCDHFSITWILQNKIQIGTHMINQLNIKHKFNYIILCEVRHTFQGLSQEHHWEVIIPFIKVIPCGGMNDALLSLVKVPMNIRN
jgi:hypothetical protein